MNSDRPSSTVPTASWNDAFNQQAAELTASHHNTANQAPSHQEPAPSGALPRRREDRQVITLTSPLLFTGDFVFDNKALYVDDSGNTICNKWLLSAHCPRGLDCGFSHPPKMIDIASDVASGFNVVNTTLNRLFTHLQQLSHGVTNCFGVLDQKLQNLSNRLGGVERGMANLNRKLENIEREHRQSRHPNTGNRRSNFQSAFPNESMRNSSLDVRVRGNIDTPVGGGPYPRPRSHSADPGRGRRAVPGPREIWK